MIIGPDDRSRPSFIGERGEQMPYQSPFGRIYRLSRLNEVRVHQLSYLFRTGPTVRKSLRVGGPLPWLAFDEWERRFLGHGRESSPIGASGWLPIDCDGDECELGALRGCLSCLQAGYHSLMHQLPWITCCPLHHEELVTQCRCGRRLLADRVRSRSRFLLVCVCGHDFFRRELAVLTQRPLVDIATVAGAKLLGFVARSRANETIISSIFLSRLDAFSHMAHPSRRKYVQPAKASYDEIKEIIDRWSYTWEDGLQIASAPLFDSDRHSLYMRARSVNARAKELGLSRLITISAHGIRVADDHVLRRDKTNGFHVVQPWVLAGSQQTAQRMLLEILRCRGLIDLPDEAKNTLQLNASQRLALQSLRPKDRAVIASALSSLARVIAQDFLSGLLEVGPRVAARKKYGFPIGEPIISLGLTSKLRIRIDSLPRNHPHFRTRSMLRWAISAPLQR